MKWLFYSSVVFILSACGNQAVRPIPVSQPVANKVFVAWQASQVADIRQAFDFDDLYCRGTVRRAASPPEPVPMAIKILRINQQDVSQQGGIWLKPGAYKLEYQIFRQGENKAVFQGQLQGELNQGARYFIQAAYFDYKKITLERCVGQYYRLKDNSGVTDYPMCDGRATILDQ